MSTRLIAQPAINELPQEVTDSIIDCLADTRDALKICALVQRSWLSRARYHLHSELTIDCGNKKVPQASYYSTGAAKYTRALKLIAPPQPPVEGGRDAKARNVWKVIPRFTELRSLTLVFSDWTTPGKSYEWLRPVTRRVTHLNLVFASFVHAVDFFEFVAMFPALESLSMTNLSFGTAALTAIPVAPPQGLQALFVRGHIVPPDVTRAFALWLCQLPRPVLPKFRLKWELGQPECLVPILDGLGPRLAHLDIPLWTAQHVPSEVIKTALHSVTFISVIPEVTKDDANEMLAFFARISTAELRAVTYDIRATTYIDTIDEHALNTIDEALFGTPYSRFGSLETVHFKIPKIPHTSGAGSVEDKLKKGLPRTHKRAALTVEVVQT